MKEKTKKKLKQLFSLALAIMLCITGITLPTPEVASADGITTDASTNHYGDLDGDMQVTSNDLLLSALKYVGYGYSLTSRNGKNGTFDCSGLVGTSLLDIGITARCDGNVYSEVKPPSTYAWYISIIRSAKASAAGEANPDNGLHLYYDTNPGDKAVTAGSKELTIQYKVLYNGTWYTTPGYDPENEDYDLAIEYMDEDQTYQTGVEPGDIILTHNGVSGSANGHMAIVVGTSANILNELNSNSRVATAREILHDLAGIPTSNAVYQKYLTALQAGNFDITSTNHPYAAAEAAALINEYNAWTNLFPEGSLYREVLESRFTDGTLPTLSDPWAVTYDASFASLWNAAGTGIGFAANLAAQSTLTDTLGRTIRPGVLMDYSRSMIDYTIDGNYAKIYPYSSVWRVEALSAETGVAITNNTEGKSAGLGRFKLSFPQNDTLSATVGVKKVAANDTTKTLAGAQFTLYGDAACTQILTDPEGNAYEPITTAVGGLGSVTVGWNEEEGTTKTIYAKETKASSALYVLSDTVYRVVLDGETGVGTWYNVSTGAQLSSQTTDGVLYFVVENTPRAGYISIDVSKSDSEIDLPIEGAQFAVYESLADAKAMTNPVQTVTTDANGEAAFAFTETDNGGKYIREVKAPDGFYIDNTIHYVSVVVTGTTDSSGNLKLIIVTPYYYEMTGDDTWTMVTSASHAPVTDPTMDTTNATYNFTNASYAITVQATKVDDATGSKLTGAEFTLYEYSKYTESYTAIGTLLDANSDGVYDVIHATQGGVSVTELHVTSQNEGRFRLKETKAPEGYLLSSVNFDFSISTDTSYGSNDIQDGGTYVVTVPNTEDYHASGSQTLTGMKVYDKELVGGEFSFVIRCTTDGEIFPERTVSNQAGGGIDFGSFTFDETMLGTWTFEVSEVAGNVSYIGYDDAVYTVTMVVTDNGDHTLNVATMVDGVGYVPKQSISFSNTYTAEGSVSIEAKKEYEKELIGGEFTFQLVNTSAPTGCTPFSLRSAKNDANGIVDFGSFSFDATMTGMWLFEMSEAAGNKSYITYDDTVYPIMIVVTDDGQGGLTVTKYLGTGSDDYIPWEIPTFTNTYSASGSTSIQAFKEFEKELSGGEFSFLIENTAAPVGNTLFANRTVQNKADGTVDFGSYAFTENMTGTWTFTVSEVAGNVAYIGYDATVYTLTVTVVDNNDGTLSITRRVGNVAYTPTTMTFINTYAASGSTSIQAFKEFEKELSGGEFSFLIENTAAPAGSEKFADRTVQNKADGTVDFGSYSFTEDMVGTWTFAVSEVAGSVAYIGYDDTKYTLTVTVVDNNDGTLTITKSVDGIEYTSTAMTFTNIVLRGYVEVLKVADRILGYREAETVYGTAYDLIIGEAGLAGVEFTLYADADCSEVVEVLVTDERGYAVSAALENGIYYLKETKVGSQYIYDSAVREILIAADKITTGSFTVTETYDNELAPVTLQLYKVGEIDGVTVGLEGVLFGIYNKADIVTPDGTIPAESLVGTITTDASGLAFGSFRLPQGAYYAKELKTVKGFTLLEDALGFNITYNHAAAQVVISDASNPTVNTPSKAKLQIQKVDQNGEPIAGVEFTLYRDAACTEVVEVLVTDENGLAQTQELPVARWENGTLVWIQYHLKETKVPNDKIMPNDSVWVIDFQNVENETLFVQSRTIENVILGIKDLRMPLMVVLFLIAALAAYYATKGRKVAE